MTYELEIINQLVVFFINAFGIFLGGWVLLADWKAALNRRFALLTFCGLLWVNFAYLGFSSKDVQMALFWYKLNLISTLIAALSLYAFFILSFLKKEKKHPVLDKIILISVFVLIYLTAFTDSVIEGVKIKEFGAEISFGGLGLLFYYSFSLFFCFVIIFYGIKKYIISSEEERLRIYYLFIGLILWILFNIIFNVLTPFIFKTVRYQHFGDYSIVFLLALTSYAIVKKKLFEIKVILTDLLVITVGVVLLILFLTIDVDFPSRTLILAVLIFYCFVGYLLVRYAHKAAVQKEVLEKMVQKRTKELEENKKLLEDKVFQLEKFHRLTVGRELKMVELKEEIKKLEEKLKEN